MELLQFLTTIWLFLVSFTSAQFPPSPEGVTTEPVDGYPGVTISYKRTTICEETAKAWAGYVHMPISYLREIETSEPYNVSMFFWYFEARNDPQNAPTGIYLAGGPGESSMYGAVNDGGPCIVASDSNSTFTNVWSMTEVANMLFIDQPVSVGYSYDALVKSVTNMLTGEIIPFSEFGGKVPPQNSTFYYGTFPSQNLQHTANTTALATITLWKFAQVWFSSFPGYTTANSKVSIWGNSYGGYWVTALGTYIQKQNVKITNGAITGTYIDLDTIGFTNGCVDILEQGEWYPHIAYKNVYDYPVISKETFEEALHIWSKPNGCRDAILECRELGDLYDPQEFGINETVNEFCLQASALCLGGILNPYSFESLPAVGNRSQFDMAHKAPDPFPYEYLAGYLNQEWVQKDLGVPVNFSTVSNIVSMDFYQKTGDYLRRAGMKGFEYLLNNGVKVTLIYGDRDYRCPWLGMEKFSLAANWTGADEFRSAGYEFLHTNSSYDGGVVRQYGNLSFTRVFQAGHDAYAYQPETVFQIFNRSLSNVDIATGQISTTGNGNNYSTTGPSSSEHIKEQLPPAPPVVCSIFSVVTTCTVDQLEALEKGEAEIVDFTIVKPAGGGGPIPGSVL